MTPQAPEPSSAARERPSSGPPSQEQPGRPWRTEGLPKKQASRQRPRWIAMVPWLVGYLLWFGVLTIQDRRSGPQTVPYTEFKSQVGNKNVAELFARGDSIEGQLRKAVPLPGQHNRTYQQFRTERPTFASDDLLTELVSG